PVVPNGEQREEWRGRNTHGGYCTQERTDQGVDDRSEVVTGRQSGSRRIPAKEVAAKVLEMVRVLMKGDVGKAVAILATVPDEVRIQPEPVAETARRLDNNHQRRGPAVGTDIEGCTRSLDGAGHSSGLPLPALSCTLQQGAARRSGDLRTNRAWRRERAPRASCGGGS